MPGPQTVAIPEDVDRALAWYHYHGEELDQFALCSWCGLPLLPLADIEDGENLMGRAMVIIKSVVEEADHVALVHLAGCRQEMAV